MKLFSVLLFVAKETIYINEYGIYKAYKEIRQIIGVVYSEE